MHRRPIANPAPHRVGFDYSQLDEDAAGEARAIVGRYHARQKAYIIDTGRDLLAVKARLEHGLFLEWLRSEIGMTPRSAQRAMGAAEALGDKSDTVSYLPPSVLYALSSPSLHALVRQEIVERIETGEDMSPRKVEAVLNEARIRSRQEKTQARSRPEERQRQEAPNHDAEARRGLEHERSPAEQARHLKFKKAKAKELAAILAPLLSADVYNHVYGLLFVAERADLQEALKEAWKNTEAGIKHSDHQRAELIKSING